MNNEFRVKVGRVVGVPCLSTLAPCVYIRQQPAKSEHGICRRIARNIVLVKVVHDARLVASRSTFNPTGNDRMVESAFHQRRNP